jgi:hypothetical protein
LSLIVVADDAHVVVGIGAVASLSFAQCGIDVAFAEYRLYGNGSSPFWNAQPKEGSNPAAN